MRARSDIAKTQYGLRPYQTDEDFITEMNANSGQTNLEKYRTLLHAGLENFQAQPKKKRGFINRDLALGQSIGLIPYVYDEALLIKIFTGYPHLKKSDILRELIHTGASLYKKQNQLEVINHRITSLTAEISNLQLTVNGMMEVLLSIMLRTSVNNDLNIKQINLLAGDHDSATKTVQAAVNNGYATIEKLINTIQSKGVPESTNEQLKEVMRRIKQAS